MRLLVVALFFLVSCTPLPQEKAMDSIKEYMNKTAHDPKSYEPGEFMIQVKKNSNNGIEFYKVTHDFRSKNMLGALVREDRVFYLDSAYKVFAVKTVEEDARAVSPYSTE